MSDEWENYCPLCILPFNEQEAQFRPCPCGYRMCVWCWHTIVTMADVGSAGTCPNCRAEFDVEAIRRAAPRRETAARAPQRAAVEERRALADVVVLDGKVVGLRGLPTSHVASLDDARRFRYFGHYGRIVSGFVPRGHGTAVLRFATTEEAARCVRGAHGAVLHGALLSAALIPVKYCSSFLKNSECLRKYCVDLHAPVANRALVRPGESAARLPLMGLVPLAAEASSRPTAVVAAEAAAAAADELSDDVDVDVLRDWRCIYRHLAPAATAGTNEPRIGRQQRGIAFARRQATMSTPCITAGTGPGAEMARPNTGRQRQQQRRKPHGHQASACQGAGAAAATQPVSNCEPAFWANGLATPIV